MEINLKKSTFFEAISMADSEKIHSETIAWIFGLDSEVLDDTQKSKVINRLFNLPTCSYQGFTSVTEENNVDIIIRTTSPPCLFAIENKLKTSEHNASKTNDPQTKSYLDELLRIKGASIYTLFLTLTGEEARDKRWINSTYETLEKALSQLTLNRKFKEHHILEDYIDSISKLALVYKHFVLRPDLFPSVFAHKQKKGNKHHLEGFDYNNYVLNQGLETIFQKAFLLEASKQIDCNQIYVGESRGMGSITFRYARFKIPDYEFELGLGFQYQNGTIKIQVASMEYLRSKKSDLPDHFYLSFKNHFEKIDSFKYQSAKSKAYASATKKITDFEEIKYNSELLGARLNIWQKQLWNHAADFLNLYSFKIEENYPKF